MLALLRVAFTKVFQIAHPRSVPNGTLAHVEIWRRCLEQAEVKTFNKYALDYVDDISLAEFDTSGAFG